MGKWAAKGRGRGAGRAGPRGARLTHHCPWGASWGLLGRGSDCGGTGTGPVALSSATAASADDTNDVSAHVTTGGWGVASSIDRPLGHCMPPLLRPHAAHAPSGLRSPPGPFPRFGFFLRPSFAFFGVGIRFE